MKKVALLKRDFKNKGGLEKYSDRLVRGFVDRGCEVFVLTSHSSPTTDIPSVTFIPIASANWSSSRSMELFDQECQKWLDHHQPDIVFGLDRNRNQTHIRAGNGVHRAYLHNRIPLDSFIKRGFRFFEGRHKKILELEKSAFESKNLKKLFTNSQMVKEEIIRYYQTDPSKISVIHNGVEWKEMGEDFYSWQERREKYASVWGLDPDAHHFLFIGNGFLRKGLKQLIYALSELSDKNFHLSVVGKDKKRKYFEHLVEKLGLSRNIHFFGLKKHTRPFYQLADTLVIPSFYDPFANVTIEALAMGLYIVSSKTNGGSEILNEKNGIVIDDLLSRESLKSTLKQSMLHRKTLQSSHQIREGVSHFDFSHQLNKMIEETLA